MHAYNASPEAIANALRGIAARALDAAITRCEEVTQGLPVTTGLLSGPPRSRWQNAAQRRPCSSWGRGGRRVRGDGRLGQQVRRYPRPVPGRRGPGGEHGCAPRDRGGDRDPQDTNHTLAFAFEEAALRADLVAVHTWFWFPPALGAAELRPTDPDRIAAEAAAEPAAALAGGAYLGVPVRHDIIHGHPARVLASYSARADLGAGCTGHPADAGSGIGSIQYACPDHAHGPVAVVPTD